MKSQEITSTSAFIIEPLESRQHLSGTFKVIAKPSLRTPYDAVGATLSKWADGTTMRGTATLIGSNDALLSGGQIWSPAHGWAVSVTVAFSQAAPNNHPYGEQRATQMFFWNSDPTSSLDSSVGLVELSHSKKSPPPLSAVSLATPADYGGLSQTIEAIGYGADGRMYGNNGFDCKVSNTLLETGSVITLPGSPLIENLGVVPIVLGVAAGDEAPTIGGIFAQLTGNEISQINGILSGNSPSVRRSESKLRVDDGYTNDFVTGESLATSAHLSESPFFSEKTPDELLPDSNNDEDLLSLLGNGTEEMEWGRR